MRLLTIAVVGILAVWFLMTVVVQLPSKRAQSIRRYDPTGNLLPGWHFFSPKPVQADFAVFYRSWGIADARKDDVSEETAGDWHELASLAERRITDALVNPGRFARKTVHSCCDRIAVLQRAARSKEQIEGFPAEAVLLSLPYLILTENVSSMCPNSAAVQFRIDVVLYSGDSPKAVTMFWSAVHRVHARKGETVAAAL